MPPYSDEILFRRFDDDGEDERQMRELMFGNAFLGKSFDPICPCKAWLGDTVLTPYIEHQPQAVRVAVHRGSGRLIGYLTGSTGGQRFEKVQQDMVRRKVLSLALYLSMPWTYLDLPTRLFALHLIMRGESERPRRPSSGVHWHYQVDKEFRGKGIGARLLDLFVQDAKQAGFDLIWAEVMAYEDRPATYFEDRGWTIYDAKSTAIFRNHVDFPVQVLCITKALSQFDAISPEHQRA